MDKPNPMYSEGMPESEILRMRELEYPSKISASLLPENLTNKKIADIGAGPNPDLGKIVKSRGGTYFAFDLNQKMAKIQKTFADNRLVIQGSTLNLPFPTESFDIIHTRFVIMNLHKKQRQQAIAELARTGKRNLVIDWDWDAFKNTNINKLIQLAKLVATVAGSDLNHGSKLKNQVSEALESTDASYEISQNEFNEGPISGPKAYAEIIRLAESMAALANNLYLTETAKDILEIKSELEKTANFAIPFTRPDIVVVDFSKK